MTSSCRGRDTASRAGSKRATSLCERCALDGSSVPPLNYGSKDFPLESTLQRFDVVQRGTDCKSLIGLC